METLLYPLMLLAGTGLVLSGLAHIAALFGFELPAVTMGLHFGVFIVWIPAMLVSHSATNRVARKDYWKAALQGCPTWLKYMVYGFFAYAFINFFLFFFSSSGSTSGAIRGFSGHWMLFYSAALAMFYAALQRKRQGLVNQCPQGHPVSPSAHYCEVCGQPVSHPVGQPRPRRSRRVKF